MSQQYSFEWINVRPEVIMFKAIGGSGFSNDDDYKETIFKQALTRSKTHRGPRPDYVEFQNAVLPRPCYPAPCCPAPYCPPHCCPCPSTIPELCPKEEECPPPCCPPPCCSAPYCPKPCFPWTVVLIRHWKLFHFLSH